MSHKDFLPSLAHRTQVRLHLRTIAAAATCLVSTQAWAGPVPGYVAPVTQEIAPSYVDDTRGVYVPAHAQDRMKTEAELENWQQQAELSRPLYAQRKPGGAVYERELNTVATGVSDVDSELNRISGDPGLLSGGRASADSNLYVADAGANHYAQAEPSKGAAALGGEYQIAQATPRYMTPESVEPAAGGKDLGDYPSLATGSAGASAAPRMQQMSGSSRMDGGMEIAIGEGVSSGGATLDMQNATVRLKEERIAVRRALQRMMDQIGGSNWAIVWDLDEANAGLPDMEISIYAEEPFMNVLNALLARLQTRSGQPLRVIKYDRTQRLVITDRNGGEARNGGAGVSGGSADVGHQMAVTETVLKESMVSLHYDEVPLVDALENIVNQAGKGQWRLRMYAGTDQVLKPAHIEEPFSVAVDRILKVFNLRYEIFPGGKLIVITASDRFGFRGVE